MTLLQISSLIKILGSNFFIWSMPVSIIILNILKEREVFEINVLIGLVIGIIINFVWESINTILNKKEYHKNWI